MKNYLIMALCALLALVAFVGLGSVKTWKKMLKTVRAKISFAMVGIVEALMLPARLWRRIKYSEMRWVANANPSADAVHGESRTMFADAAITTRHLLYKAGTDDNHAAVCDASSAPIGTIDDEVATADITAMPVTLNLLGRGATKRMVANGAVIPGQAVYAAASGKVGVSGIYHVGIALTTTTTDGDIVEVDSTVTRGVLAPNQAVIATKSVLASESGSTFFLNAAGVLASTLPAPAAGLKYTFIVAVAPVGGSYTVAGASGTPIQGVITSKDLNGATDSGATGGTGVLTLAFVTAKSQIGDRAEFISDGTNWYVAAVTGGNFDSITLS